MEREDVPCVEGDGGVVGWVEGEGRYLGVVEVELFDVGEILPEGWVYFVRVEGVALDGRD